MASLKTRAFWTLAPGQGQIRNGSLPTTRPAEDKVLVRTLYTGISRGTESLVFRGEVPQSEYERMRAPFQEGDFPGPVKYGYANVGCIERGPDALVGKNVFCLYPHQTCYWVPAEAVIPLPDGVSPEYAVLASNMETAVNALWDAAPGVGDRIAVVGLGVVGALVSYLCAGIPGTQVQGIDTDASREALAQPLGFRFVNPDEAEPGNDLVVHASGSPEGATLALSLAGQESRIIEMSWFGDKSVALPLGGEFHARRLTLRSSQVGSVSPSHAPRWSHRDRLSLALRLLADPALSCLIDGESDFESLPDVMRQLSLDPRGALCRRIRYP